MNGIITIKFHVDFAYLKLFVQKKHNLQKKKKKWLQKKLNAMG
jgi:hypothetical protein